MKFGFEEDIIFLGRVVNPSSRYCADLDLIKTRISC